MHSMFFLWIGRPFSFWVMNASNNTYNGHLVIHQSILSYDLWNYYNKDDANVLLPANMRGHFFFFSFLTVLKIVRSICIESRTLYANKWHFLDNWPFDQDLYVQLFTSWTYQLYLPFFMWQVKDFCQLQMSKFLTRLFPFVISTCEY